MEYQILSSLRTPSAIEAARILEQHVNDALKAGGQLVGGVSVTYCHAYEGGQDPGYAAFQSILMPADKASDVLRDPLATTLVMVPTGPGVEGDYYLEVNHQRAGYLYRAADGTWTVGVMRILGGGDVGPFAEGLDSQAAALDFARQQISR